MNEQKNASQPVALVTGASSGIGMETAKALANKGYKVYAGARRLDKMQSLANLGVVVVELDVTRQALIDAVAEKILKENNRIDLLVNSAGYGLHGAIEEVSLSDARQQFEVNVFGCAGVIRAFLPSMRQQKSGWIINISSLAGKISPPMSGWYNASKHALEALSDSLRLELMEFGIKVILVQPASVRSEFGDIALKNLRLYGQIADYANWNSLWAKSIELSKSEQNTIPPAMIAAEIIRILEAKKVKPRYVVPSAAKSFLFLTRMFSDSFVDKLILAKVKSGR
jgi:short-subunit dehydrogenase